MPIRINLLAEDQAAEDLRRKDPVKRAILFGVCCAGLMAAASFVFASQVMNANRDAEAYSDRIHAITKEHSVVMASCERLREVNLNIRGLDIFASERFLNGSLLNALQKVSADNVQLIRVRTDHSYTITDEGRSKTNSGKVIKPATAAEKITLVLEARDSSASPGDQVTKFKNAFGKSAYFISLLGTNNEMRLVNLSPPQLHPAIGRPAVQFTLESHAPEKVRTDIGSPGRYAPAIPAAKDRANKSKERPVESNL